MPPRAKKVSPDAPAAGGEGVPVDLELKPLLQEAKEIQDRIKPDLDRLEELKDDIRVMTGGKHSGPGVTVSPNRRLDVDALAEAYPVKTHPFLWALSIDTAAVKAKLPPETVEGFYKNVGKERVTIK